MKPREGEEGLATVHFIELLPLGFRVLIKGLDDDRLEKDFSEKEENAARKLFFDLCRCGVLPSRESLFEQGFGYG